VVNLRSVSEDEKKTPTPEPDPEPKIFGLPMASFVKGGTSSMADDRRVAELKADSIHRRKLDDQQRAASLVPIEQGGAKMFTNKLTDNPDVEQSYVELCFVNARGEPILHETEDVKCLADIVVLSPDELAIIMVCPSCFSKTNMPLDQCQIRIRQSNKKWDLDLSKAGTPIFWNEGRDAEGKKLIKVYRSAGVIRESEKFTCDCGWSGRIVNNKVFPG
jgi:hypothetical protein